MLKLRIAALAGAALLGALAAGCGEDMADTGMEMPDPGMEPAPMPDPSVDIILDWFPNSNHAGVFLAEQDGIFSDAGLAVETVTPSDPTAIISTVATGRADFGITYPTELLLARSQGVEVVSVLALVQHPLVSVMTLADSGIEEPGDLAGKRIGFPGIPTQQAMLETTLESAGLTLEDVTLSNVGFDLVRVLLAGEVDAIMGAYYTHESILIEQHDGEEPNIILVEEHGVPDFYELLLITSESLLEEDPDLVERVADAVRRGYEGAAERPQESVDALVSIAGSDVVDEMLERRGAELLVPLWTDSGRESVGRQRAERWDMLARWMKAEGLIDADLDAGAAWTDRFVP